MYGVDKKPEATIELGEGLVTVKRKGVTRPVVAVILGHSADETGNINRLVLDRLIHKPYETDMGGWHVTGAVCSVLIR